MLRIYSVILDTLTGLRPALDRIERRDADLGRQLRRAAASVALNTAEGMYSRGRNRAARYHSALGSARETLACLEVAEALYAMPLEEAVRARLNEIVGTLYPLHAPRPEDPCPRPPSSRPWQIEPPGRSA
jgi:four helix bundle protein